MGKRCVSTCRGIGEEECVKPCSFTRKKYCRLSASLKMIPPDCRVVKRGREKRSITPNKILPVIRSLGNETPSPIKIRRLASGTPQSGTRGSNLVRTLKRILNNESNTDSPKTTRPKSRKSTARKSRSTKSRSKKSKPAK
jgi:hypothetical protein